MTLSPRDCRGNSKDPIHDLPLGDAFGFRFFTLDEPPVGPRRSTAFARRTARGRGLDYRHVGHGFRDAVKRAGLQAPGRLSLHSFRHGFASLVVAEGMNVVFVSRQLGHANPTITLGVYAHLFERADHAAAAREALEASYAETVGVTS